MFINIYIYIHIFFKDAFLFLDQTYGKSIVLAWIGRKNSRCCTSLCDFVWWALHVYLYASLLMVAAAQERYCLIADRGNPLDGTGTGDTRTVWNLKFVMQLISYISSYHFHSFPVKTPSEVRVITRYQQNPFDLRPPKAWNKNSASSKP